MNKRLKISNSSNAIDAWDSAREDIELAIDVAVSIQKDNSNKLNYHDIVPIANMLLRQYNFYLETEELSWMDEE